MFLAINIKLEEDSTIILKRMWFMEKEFMEKTLIILLVLISMTMKNTHR